MSHTMAHLIYFDQDGKQIIPIPKKLPLSIGRSKDNDLAILGDPSISRKHCMIHQGNNESGFFLRDMGSSNGTKINSIYIFNEDSLLSDGDKFMIGHAEFIFSIEEEEQQCPSKNIKEIQVLAGNSKSTESLLEKTAKLGKDILPETMPLKTVSQKTETQESDSKSENLKVFPTATEIGGYEIMKVLGKGTFATVYLAYQISVKRTIALKIYSLPLGIPDISEAKDSFLEQVRTAGRIQHPNIIPYFDAGILKNFCYVSMAYMPEGNLEEKVRTSGHLSEGEMLLLVRKIAGGLSHVLKEYGLVHMNIRPRNIMFNDNNEPVLMDIGFSPWVARYLQTNRNVYMGSSLYMSPEQAMDRDTDWRSDLYSLGISLYEALTGKLPFDAMNTKYQTQKIKFPKNVGISDKTVELIHKMTAKNPADRFKHWSSLITAIAAILKDNKQTTKQSSKKKFIRI